MRTHSNDRLKGTLDLLVLVDVVAKLGDLVFGEVADLRVAREAECVADLLRRRLADPEDVGEPDLEPLLVRQVDACDTCHVSSLTPDAACGEDSCK